MLEERTREWIEKPVFYGAPLSWVKEYFQGRLIDFRRKHHEFDEFLNELGELLEKENNQDYRNIIRFIKGDTEPNWVTSNRSLFNIMIKLYNLCLSPKQAYEYIKECQRIYRTMVDNIYELDDSFKISIRRSRWNGKARKFINCSLSPKNKINDRDYYWWFDIAFSDFVYDDHFNDIDLQCDVSVEIRSGKDIFKDALSLFDYHQRKEFRRKLFYKAIDEFLNEGILKNKKEVKIDFLKDYASEYNIDYNGGFYEISEIKSK